MRRFLRQNRLFMLFLTIPVLLISCAKRFGTGVGQTAWYFSRCGTSYLYQQMPDTSNVPSRYLVELQQKNFLSKTAELKKINEEYAGTRLPPEVEVKILKNGVEGFKKVQILQGPLKGTKGWIDSLYDISREYGKFYILFLGTPEDKKKSDAAVFKTAETSDISIQDVLSSQHYRKYVAAPVRWEGEVIGIKQKHNFMSIQLKSINVGRNFHFDADYQGSGNFELHSHLVVFGRILSFLNPRAQKEAAVIPIVAAVKIQQ